MTRCIVYDTIRRHHPELLKECAQLISDNSVPAMAEFLIQHGWGTNKLRAIVHLHKRIVETYGDVRDLPHAKQQQIRRYMQPLFDAASKETVALIEKGVTK